MSAHAGARQPARVAGLEPVERYVDDPELSSTDLRADAGIHRLRGVKGSVLTIDTSRWFLAGFRHASQAAN